MKNLYDITKNLYIKHDRYSSSKYHKVKQINDGFEIAKQGYVLK